MVNRKRARTIAFALGALAVVAAIAAYTNETSATLKVDVAILIAAIVVGVGVVTVR